MKTVAKNAYGQIFKRLEDIARELWFLEHLELDLEIGLREAGTQLDYRPTLKNTLPLWRHLRKSIRTHRIKQDHLITEPRLRSLDLVLGSGSSQLVSGVQGLRTGSCLTFAIDISPHGELARRDVANVYCTEFEALKRIVGSDERNNLSLKNWTQRQYYENLSSITEAGEWKHQGWCQRSRPEVSRPGSFWDLRCERRFYHKMTLPAWNGP